MKISKANKSIFKWKTLSLKQKAVLHWWTSDKYKDKDVIISDGAVRSGKTVIFTFSFVAWAMNTFNEENFAICGKTIGSLRRNVIKDLIKMCRGRRWQIHEKRNENLIIIRRKDKNTGKIMENYFYLFGGKDESSQDLIQGITLAGLLCDEVALMPESFVNQATARCSIEGSKMWFTCNPEGPYHWFKINWIDKLEEKNGIRIHFTLLDNLHILGDKIVNRYKNMYSGVFYDRYIMGLWVLAEGIIYNMFNKEMVVDEIPDLKQAWIGSDYGTSNATTFVLCGQGYDDVLYIIDEYYHSGKDGHKKSPQQYANEFKDFEEKARIQHLARYKYIYIDPSAEGFIMQLWTAGVKGVMQANNAVIPGIQLVQSLMTEGKFKVHRRCKHVLQELSSYRWDEKAQERGEDKPIKDHDHCLDAIRYVVNTNRLLFLRLIRGGDK